MSSFNAIWTVSRALQQILWEALDADHVLRDIVGSAAVIVLSNPTDVQRDPANRLSHRTTTFSESAVTKG